MLAVVVLERLGADVGRQGVLGVGQGREFEGHRASSRSNRISVGLMNTELVHAGMYPTAMRSEPGAGHRHSAIRPGGPGTTLPAVAAVGGDRHELERDGGDQHGGHDGQPQLLGRDSRGRRRPTATGRPARSRSRPAMHPTSTHRHGGRVRVSRNRMARPTPSRVIVAADRASSQGRGAVGPGDEVDAQRGRRGDDARQGWRSGRPGARTRSGPAAGRGPGPGTGPGCPR